IDDGPGHVDDHLGLNIDAEQVLLGIDLKTTFEFYRCEYPCSLEKVLDFFRLENRKSLCRGAQVGQTPRFGLFVPSFGITVATKDDCPMLLHHRLESGRDGAVQVDT